MPTIPDALRSIEKRLGIPQSHGRTVARKLQDAKMLPCGSPGEQLPIRVKDVANLILALASDAVLKAVPETTERYASLVPHGVNQDALPDGVGDRLIAKQIAPNPRDFLAKFIVMAVTGDDEARAYLAEYRIEIVANWPEVDFDDGEKVTRYRQAGALASHWDAPFKRSTTITGGVLIDIARDLKLTR